MDKNTLTHMSWMCKYHIIFAPKFRRKAIYGYHVSKVNNDWHHKYNALMQVEKCAIHIRL